jgi:hypothetical protein
VRACVRIAGVESRSDDSYSHGLNESLPMPT